VLAVEPVHLGGACRFAHHDALFDQPGQDPPGALRAGCDPAGNISTGERRIGARRWVQVVVSSVLPSPSSWVVVEVVVGVLDGVGVVAPAWW